MAELSRGGDLNPSYTLRLANDDRRTEAQLRGMPGVLDAIRNNGEPSYRVTLDDLEADQHKHAVARRDGLGPVDRVVHRKQNSAQPGVHGSDRAGGSVMWGLWC